MNWVFWGFIAMCLQVSLGQITSPTPSIPQVIKESKDNIRSFVRLWEYSLEQEKDSPLVRSRLGPKTLLLPTDFSMANIFPQDIGNPLYSSDSRFVDLRKELILSHLVQQTVPLSAVDQGISLQNLMGDDILLVADPFGTTYANGIKVRKTLKLPDETQIFVLQEPLFNLKSKLRQAFNEVHSPPHQEPTGPPLDIPGQVIRFPGNEAPRPPSPPPRPSINVFDPQAAPPAPPPVGFFQPPAPPS